MLGSDHQDGRKGRELRAPPPPPPPPLAAAHASAVRTCRPAPRKRCLKTHNNNCAGRKHTTPKAPAPAPALSADFHDAVGERIGALTQGERAGEALESAAGARSRARALAPAAGCCECGAFCIVAPRWGRAHAAAADPKHTNQTDLKNLPSENHPGHLLAGKTDKVGERLRREQERAAGAAGAAKAKAEGAAGRVKEGAKEGAARATDAAAGAARAAKGAAGAARDGAADAAAEAKNMINDKVGAADGQLRGRVTGGGGGAAKKDVALRAPAEGAGGEAAAQGAAAVRNGAGEGTGARVPPAAAAKGAEDAEGFWRKLQGALKPERAGGGAGRDDRGAADGGAVDASIRAKGAAKGVIDVTDDALPPEAAFGGPAPPLPDFAHKCSGAEACAETP